MDSEKKEYELPGIRKVELVIKGGKCLYRLGTKQTKFYPTKIFSDKMHVAHVATELGVKEVDIAIAEDRQHQKICKILEDLKEEERVNKLMELPDRGEDQKFSVYLPLRKIKEGKPQDYLISLVPSEEGEIKKILLNESRFIPLETTPSQNFYERDKDFPSIYKELRSVQSNYLFFEEEIHYDLLSLGSASTYFREIFATYPYFDLFSSENETGKTTAMKVLIWCSYYGFCLLGPTEAVLFRAIDSCHSPIGIDELDKLYLNYRENANLFSLLDSGYSKGLPSYRVDRSKGPSQITGYDGFGLKAYTRTREISRELLSRSITINMLRNKGFKRIKRDPTPNDFELIRDKLYAYRLKHWRQVKEAYEEVRNSDLLIGRLADLYYPLLTMAKLKSTQLFSKVLEYAKREERAKVQAELDQVDKALLRTLTEKNLVGEVELKKITDLVNKKLIEQGDIDKRHLIWPKIIETKLRGFGFKPSSLKIDDRVRYSIDEERPKRLEKIYL
jgi:hypothetical protein